MKFEKPSVSCSLTWDVVCWMKPILTGGSQKVEYEVYQQQKCVPLIHTLLVCYKFEYLKFSSKCYFHVEISSSINLIYK